jgi:glycosyltransferase involved in cell wall biosynthesis
LTPVGLLFAVLETRHVYQEIKPDLVHHVAVVPTVIGSLAALGLTMARLNALAGLGFAFTSETARARVARPFAKLILGWLLRRPATTVLVQNPDDYDVVARLGLRKDAIVLIPGSGVDTERLQSMPEPSGPFTVAFVGRLLDDKGVQTLVRAHELLRAHGHAIQTLVAGDPDPFNPASISDRVLDTWRRIDGLRFLGHVEDISTVWAQSHVAILPSRREGLPMSLLEAAACRRPLVATDVPGCREIARPGVNAFLVPADNPEALARAIEQFMSDPEMRLRFGIASRQIAVSEYSSKRIGKEITDLYSRLLSD